jgi:hypothetical protein
MAVRPCILFLSNFGYTYFQNIACEFVYPMYNLGTKDKYYVDLKKIFNFNP